MASTLRPAVRELLDILPDEVVLTPERFGNRSRNFWDASPLQAAALLRPRSTADVAAILSVCNRHSQSVVAHGGRTGVCDGDRATPDDVVISLDAMNQIEDIDPVGRTVRVQAGCVLQTLQEAVAAQDLYLPLDLGARGSCTIGGNVATNAGGVNVIRYGMTRALVLGLETVLADGTVLSSLNQMLKNNSGYDLKQLFIGSEGTLGIVTRVVLALKEKPTSTHSALLALSDGAQVMRLLKHMDRELGGALSSFEVMWGDYYRAVTRPGAHPAPLSREHAFYVVLEMQGADQAADAERFQSALAVALQEGMMADAIIAGSLKDRHRLWAVREDFSSILQYKPQFLYDVSLPLRHMLSYVETVRARLLQRWPECLFYVLGHIGDGNLHFFVCPQCEEPGQHLASDEAVYGPLQAIGGAVSAEHGIGLEKKRWLPLSRSAEEIGAMRRLKAVFDPNGILNPGKIFERSA
jgi:FAD/FMN-containing dehydrogenase